MKYAQITCVNFVHYAVLHYVRNKHIIQSTNQSGKKAKRRQEMWPNSMELQITLKRGELCNLIIAVGEVERNLRRENRDCKKWTALYEELKNQLHEFDDKHL